jgi:DNA-binding transcriptional ArsR family regulator
MTWLFSNFSSRKHSYCILRKKSLGFELSDTDEYDKIFALLKHPVRRQILLVLERKSEASFTDLQNAVGIDDTGLMSYHLKELAPLVEQSERGKYRLSEMGQAGVELFRRVEREKRGSSTMVRREIEKWMGEIVFLALIIGLALTVPLSVDVYLSVQNIYQDGLSSEWLVSMFLVSLFGMIFGVLLFTFYDRHYFSKSIKASVVHSTIFAMVIALLSATAFYAVYSFEAATMAISSSNNQRITWLFGALRPSALLVSAPLVTYALNMISRRKKYKLKQPSNAIDALYILLEFRMSWRNCLGLFASLRAH